MRSQKQQQPERKKNMQVSIADQCISSRKKRGKESESSIVWVEEIK